MTRSSSVHKTYNNDTERLKDIILHMPHLLSNPTIIEIEIKQPIVDLTSKTSELKINRDNLLTFISSQEDRNWQRKVLLKLRNPQSELGQLCRRSLDLSKRVSVRTFWEEERTFLAAVQQKFDEVDSGTKTHHLRELLQCLNGAFFNYCVPWRVRLELAKERPDLNTPGEIILALVTQGADPNATTLLSGITVS